MMHMPYRARSSVERERVVGARRRGRTLQVADR